MLTLASAHASFVDNNDLREYGPAPALPAPEQRMVPVVNIAPAKPWQGDSTIGFVDLLDYRPGVAPLAID